MATIVAFLIVHVAARHPGAEEPARHDHAAGKEEAMSRSRKALPGVDAKLLIKDATKLMPEPTRRLFLRGGAKLRPEPGTTMMIIALSALIGVFVAVVLFKCFFGGMEEFWKCFPKAPGPGSPRRMFPQGDVDHRALAWRRMKMNVFLVLSAGFGLGAYFALRQYFW